MVDINEWIVLVAGIVAMIVGGVWYQMFSRQWMIGMGWNPDDAELKARLKKSAGKAYLQMFILSLVQAYVLAHVIAMSKSVFDYGIVATGLSSGFWMWLGFVLPLKYGDKLWGGKQFKYVAIDLAYYLVLLLILGVVISVWG